ncbi:2-dehydropantoate 2-reductase [Halobacteriaceae archaeon GCM10025711]
MKVAVYGAGGVGAYFGGRLAAAGADVHLIARGEHLRALRNDGLTVESIHGDFHVDLPATDDPADVGPVDYVLFCVKSFDTADAAARLEPMLHDETAVVSLQNGVDNEEQIADEVGWDHVMGGVAYIFSTIAEPGVVEHTGGPAEIVFGEMDGTRSDRAERFLAACDDAGFDATLSEDVESVLWDKYTFICAQAGMTAAVRRPVGDIRDVPESWAMFQDVLSEVTAVADAEGVALPDDTVAKWVGFAEDLEPGAYSSLHYDMTHGKRMELEALFGVLTRRAADHGVDVPMSDAIYGVLRPWAVHNERD